MEKDKMIEEMVSKMGEWAIENKMCFDSRHAESLAKYLIGKNVLKVPEGSVVLTKEELEAHDKGVSKEAVKEFAQELIKIFEEQKKRYDMCIDQRRRDLLKLSENEQEAKEYTIRCEGKENGQWVMADKAISYINKLLKEKYGVEVE